MLISGAVRTTRIQPLRTEKRKDAAGNEYVKKTIFFTVASQRDYKQAVLNEDGTPKMENGQVVKEYGTDFLFCKATGELAEIIEKYANLTQKVSDGKGGLVDKIVSRQVYIEGRVETYKKDEVIEVTKRVAINGQEYDIKFEQAYRKDAQVIRIEKFRFLDAMPEQLKTQMTAPVAGVTVSPAQPAPVQAVNAAPVTPYPVQSVATGPIVIDANDQNYAPINADDDCPF